MLNVAADLLNDRNSATPEGATSAMKHFLMSVPIALLFFSTCALAQAGSPNTTVSGSAIEKTQSEPRSAETLRQFNTSLVALTRRVSPAVVQIMVTGYGPSGNDKNNNNVALIVRQRAIGSGVIVDPDGYIVTNAHVVEGALRIRVTLPQADGSSPLDIPPIGKRKVLDATLVGTHKETDLAVIKVDAHNLPVLPLGATRPVYPGELVLAIGSPEALQSSVTMGVVSSVWRQPDPAQPMVYIQTDAPINPGNSGGPLIDLDGYVVGLNTYILSEGGGSEGIGFAIPARIVRFVYDNLRKYGHVHRTEIQAGAQEITPTLAEGLGLSQDWGVIISDVTSEGPGATAGLKVNDIIYSVDGRQIVGLPGFSAALYLHPPDETLNMEVVRGTKRVSLAIPAVQHYDKEDDLAVLVDPKNFIGRLGVFLIDFNDKLRAVLPDADVSGVVVAAQSPGLSSYTSSLRAGDIIHSINQTPIESVEQLKSILSELKPRQAVVLQIERSGGLQYIAFEWGD